jgi:uncharacterized protein (TIGR02284 family)
MNHSNHILNGLVAATRDGKSFYEHAATKVANPELKTLFVRIAKVKGDIVQGLSSEISAGSEINADPNTWGVDFNKRYAKVRALLGDTDYAYVAQLEDSEDQLMKAFDRALNDTDTSACAHAVITRYMPEVHVCHDIMLTRKVALKKAA